MYIQIKFVHIFYIENLFFIINHSLLQPSNDGKHTTISM